ncbi:RNA recognition motif 2-domain-containing protein [Pilaira anomala]|nr:RNA recognition motif 2-domain-containing protein [Pilaira anomala]
MTIISYYKMKDAETALEFINKKYPTFFKAHYARSCLLKQRHDDQQFLVSLNLEPNNSSNYKKQLSDIGSIYSISETSISSKQKFITIEYDDYRAVEDLFKNLNNATIDGINYQVLKCESIHQSCPCQSTTTSSVSVNNNRIIQRPCPKSKQSEKTPHDVNFSYFSVDPFTSESSSASSDAAIEPDIPVSPKPKEVTATVNKKGTSTNNKTKPKEKKSYELDLKKIASGKDKRTTFMIRNIPNKYTQKMLIDSLNETHANTYDFVYLRMDFKNKCNVGYAFINFIDPKSIISFAEQKDGKRWELFNSTKTCSLSYATIQGKEALVRKFKSSPVMDKEDAFKPKIFYSSGPNKGKEQPFAKTSPPHTRSTKHYRKH